MKAFLFVLGFTVSLFSKAQDGFELVNDRITFTKVYNAESKSINHILAKGREWMLLTDSAMVKPAVINLEDKKLAKIIVTRSTKFDPDKDRAFIIVAKWELQAREGSYVLTMLELKGYQSLRINDRLTEQPIDYNAIIRQEQGGSGPYKPPFFNKYAPVVKEQIVAQADALNAYILH